MTCPECHREVCNRLDGAPAYSGTRECAIATAGFLRGAAWMLETAKREACIVHPAYAYEGDVWIRWTDVDAALEARKK